MARSRRQSETRTGRRPARPASEIVRRALNSRRLPQLISALGVDASAHHRHALYSAIEELASRRRARDPAMRELLHHTCEMHIAEWRAIGPALAANGNRHPGTRSHDVIVFSVYARSLVEAGDLNGALAIVQRGATLWPVSGVLQELKILEMLILRTMNGSNNRDGYGARSG